MHIIRLSNLTIEFDQVPRDMDVGQAPSTGHRRGGRDVFQTIYKLNGFSKAVSPNNPSTYRLLFLVMKLS